MNSCILTIVHINNNYSTKLFFKLSNFSFLLKTKNKNNNNLYLRSIIE